MPVGMCVSSESVGSISVNGGRFGCAGAKCTRATSKAQPFKEAKVSSKKMGLRRVAIVGLSTLVATTMMSGVASANSTFAFTRIAGVDRWATSVATAQQFGASTDVILASGESGHYPDALTANYLAGAKHAPILLTHADATPANTACRPLAQFHFAQRRERSLPRRSDRQLPGRRQARADPLDACGRDPRQHRYADRSQIGRASCRVR